MNIVISFHKGDIAQAVRLIDRIESLGKTSGSFFLLTTAALQDPAMLRSGWQWLTDYAQLDSDWSTGGKDASAANSVWRQAAREMMRLKSGPWLWLEPDAVPLCPGWIQSIQAEYERGRMPFMGGKAPTGNRMSGVAVYHQNTPAIVIKPFTCDPWAFDYAGADDFKARGIHFTDLIADQFRCEPFKDAADFKARVPAGAVLHHGDKTESIYRVLAEMETLPSPELGREGGEENANCSPVVSLPVSKPFSQIMTEHLDEIISRIGGDPSKRQLFYAALKQRGIEAGRKKRSPKAAMTAK